MPLLDPHVAQEILRETIIYFQLAPNYNRTIVALHSDDISVSNDSFPKFTPWYNCQWLSSSPKSNKVFP